MTIVLLVALLLAQDPAQPDNREEEPAPTNDENAEPDSLNPPPVLVPTEERTAEPDPLATTPVQNDETDDGNEPGQGDNGQIEWFTNVALVVVTMALAVVAVLQLILNRRIFYATHRPRLLVRNIVVPQLDKLNRNTPMNEMEEAYQQGFDVTFDVVNAGSTVGKSVSGSAHISITSALRMKHPDEKPFIFGQLEGGESRSETVRIDTLAPDLICRLIDGDVLCYVIGVLRYEDSGGVKRKTGFCRKFNPDTARFEAEKNPDYEYTD